MPHLTMIRRCAIGLAILAGTACAHGGARPLAPTERSGLVTAPAQPAPRVFAAIYRRGPAYLHERTIYQQPPSPGTSNITRR